MTRKKVTLAYITNDSERKASFKKRKKGLIKKVHELSTLCDVQACAIIYSPYDHQPEVFPSHLGAQAVLARFRKLPEMDQTRKMFNQDSFNRERIRKAQENLRRVQKENKRKEMELFLVRYIQGKVSAYEFDMENYPVMKQVILNYLRDLQAKYEKSRKGNNNQEGQMLALLAPPGPLDNSTPPPPPMDPNFQLTKGTDAMVMSSNFITNDYQFQSNFFPDPSSMVPFAPPYFPALTAPVTTTDNNMAAPAGGEDKLEISFPWNLLESTSGGLNNMVNDGLGWDEGMVLPPYPNFSLNNVNDNYIHSPNNNTFINPSGSEPASSGSVMNPNPSFNPSSSFAPPGFGFDPDSSFNQFIFMPVPSASDAAPGSGDNN